MNEVKIDTDLFISANLCAWHSGRQAVLLSDLHLGYEASLEDEGFSFPVIQKEEILDRLSTMKRRYDPEAFIVLGDFKHEFGRSDKKEFKEVLDVMDYILEDSELIIVRGNHDNYLRNLTEMKNVVLYEEDLHMDSLLLAHGHERLKERGDSLSIIGHEHPAIQTTGELGDRMKLKCFLYHPKEKILVLPALSPMAEGRDVIKPEGFFSEALRPFERVKDEFQVYAITDQGLMDFQTIGAIREASLKDR